jgi:Xaa-Pro aminopeptidase
MEGPGYESFRPGRNKRMKKDTYRKRLNSLKEKMKEEGTDAFFVYVNEGYNWENAYYLSGFRGTSCSLLLTSEREYLVTDGRYIQQAKDQSDFQVIDQGKRGMARVLLDLLLEIAPQCTGFEGDRVPESFFRKLQRPELKWKDISHVLPHLRRFKDEGEIENIRVAADMASRAFEKTLETVCEGISESNFSNLLEYNVREEGAECGWPGHSFVVVSGERSSMPHGAPTGKKIMSGDWVTVDFGATYNGYVSDITRNFVIGRPSNKMMELHDLVIRAHEEAAAVLGPGVTGRDIDSVARSIIEEAGYGSFFNHGLGHGIGLEIHERPRLSSASEDVLSPGDVVTVEPGIYIQGLGGVRIEDDYLVTPEGAECLTGKFNRRMISV